MSCYNIRILHPSFHGTNGMGKPNQFITVVTCSECGRTGTATWKENENFDDADYEMVLTDVSDGFRFDSEGKIYCIDCGVDAITARNST
jgi:hypothetical protein